MRMYLGGQWVEGRDQIEVLNPFDGSVVDTVPRADSNNVQQALSSAERGAKIMARLSAYDRWKILKRAAELIDLRKDELARLISSEEAKVISEGMGEVKRAVETIMVSAEEAKRIHGETIPSDADPGGRNHLGFTLRVPCGIVLAISPFNFPLNLVSHKVGPAIAGGNAVIIKPATDTPLSALKLTEILLEAGLPPEGIQCLTGSGSVVGEALIADRRVRKISFTGSREVGEHICRSAGIKKLTMELGSNCPLIIMPDADIDAVVSAVVATSYANAGQVCISTQRVLASRTIYSEFLDALQPKVAALTTGNQFHDSTRVGPMVRESDAIRVESWIKEAANEGARVVVGGHREGANLAPAVVADVKPGMRICRDELFGPAIGVMPFDNIEDAIAQANSTNFGLSAGIFTRDIQWAVKFAREAESGNIHVNWGPHWRADLMPYGGLKESGFGKEGPRYAIEEMTELKMVVFHAAN